MFSRLQDWYREHKAWKRDHAATWAGWTESGASGLSRFQEACEPAIQAALSSDGRDYVEREVIPTSEGWSAVYGKISDTAIEIWLYPDGVGFLGDGIDVRLEEWDARTPEELKEDAVAHAKRLLQDLPRVV